MEIKPLRVFYLFTLIGAILLAFSWFVPEEGIQFSSNITIKWIPISDLIPETKILAKEIVKVEDKCVVAPVQIDDSTIFPTDSTTHTVLPISPESDSVVCLNNLFYNKLGKVGLDRFFSRLNNRDSILAPLHILHFGDSQLDGDRISRFLRELFQEKFGGGGCGFVNCLDPVKQISSVWIDTKGNWSMNWVYDVLRQHNDKDFGLLGSNVIAKDVDKVSLIYTPSKLGNSNCRNYQEVKLFLSQRSKKQVVNCFADNALYQSDTLKSSHRIDVLNYHLPYPPHRLEFSFGGTEPPILHGCLLDATRGVQVDNIALRGQLFTRFLPRDSMLVSSMANVVNPGLIILQFGANLLPTKAPEYHSYQHQIERQIFLIKSFIPNATILVVGVGDAAERVDGVVRPLCSVKPIADAQKRAALNSGALYFDLLTAMGGPGTMVKWADGEPRRALTDYIHFNLKGGKEVAKLIFTAIDSNYQIWCNQTKGKSL